MHFTFSVFIGADMVSTFVLYVNKYVVQIFVLICFIAQEYEGTYHVCSHGHQNKYLKIVKRNSISLCISTTYWIKIKEIELISYQTHIIIQSQPIELKSNWIVRLDNTKPYLFHNSDCDYSQLSL